VKPVVAYLGDVGIYSVTFPADVQDELLSMHSLNLRVASAWVESADALHYTARARVTGPNVVEVRVFLDNAPDDGVARNIVVQVW
jgi:hypothetical protein